MSEPVTSRAIVPLEVASPVLPRTTVLSPTEMIAPLFAMTMWSPFAITESPSTCEGPTAIGESLTAATVAPGGEGLATAGLQAAPGEAGNPMGGGGPGGPAPPVGGGGAGGGGAGAGAAR